MCWVDPVLGVHLLAPRRAPTTRRARAGTPRSDRPGTGIDRSTLAARSLESGCQRIRRSSSRPSGDRSEYPQFEHRSMLLWEYVVEFPTLRARGRRSTRHHQRATETLRRMRRLSGTPLRATSRRSGRRNPTASEARSTPEQRRGRAPSRRSLLPVPARRRAQRIPLERVSEPGRSTHQPRSGDSLSSGRGNVEFCDSTGHTGSEHRRSAVCRTPRRVRAAVRRWPGGGVPPPGLASRRRTRRQQSPAATTVLGATACPVGCSPSRRWLLRC